MPEVRRQITYTCGLLIGKVLNPLTHEVEIRNDIETDDGCPEKIITNLDVLEALLQSLRDEINHAGRGGAAGKGKP